MRISHILAFILALLCCVSSFAKTSLADSTACIKPTDQAKLLPMRGDYIASNLLKDILKERNIFKGEKEWHGFFAEILVHDGHTLINKPPAISYVSGSNWHEGELFSEDGVDKCLTPLNENKFQLSERDHAGEVYEKASPSVQQYLFTKLLGGCYLSDQHEKFCFADSTVAINGQKSHSELQLDESELAGEGNYLKVDSEPLFWVLVPTAKGWNLYHSDWATSDNYVSIDLQKPWKVLTRIHSTSN
jgi:hypothetical protein